MRDGVAVGALTMYAKGVDAFDEQIRSLLLEMAKDKPRDEQELLEITGVGEHKLRKYGSIFLAALAQDDATA